MYPADLNYRHLGSLGEQETTSCSETHACLFDGWTDLY